MITVTSFLGTSIQAFADINFSKHNISKPEQDYLMCFPVGTDSFPCGTEHITENVSPPQKKDVQPAMFCKPCSETWLARKDTIVIDDITGSNEKCTLMVWSSFRNCGDNIEINIYRISYCERCITILEKDRKAGKDELQWFKFLRSMVFDKVARKILGNAKGSVAKVFEQFISDCMQVGEWWSGSKTPITDHPGLAGNNPTKHIQYDNCGLVCCNRYVKLTKYPNGDIISEPVYQAIPNQFNGETCSGATNLDVYKYLIASTFEENNGNIDPFYDPKKNQQVIYSPKILDLIHVIPCSPWCEKEPQKTKEDKKDLGNNSRSDKKQEQVTNNSSQTSINPNKTKLKQSNNR